MEHAVRDTGRGVDSIRGMMAAGRTGCLHVHVPGRGAARLYLLEGDVIAAVSPSDPELLLNRAIARGKMPASAGAVDHRVAVPVDCVPGEVALRAACDALDVPAGCIVRYPRINHEQEG